MRSHIVDKLCGVQQLELNGEPAARPCEDLRRHHHHVNLPTITVMKVIARHLPSCMPGGSTHVHSAASGFSRQSVKQEGQPYLMHPDLEFHAHLELARQTVPRLFLNICRYQSAQQGFPLYPGEQT